MLSPLPRRSGWAYCFALSPGRISLPRKGCRVGLRIVLFEACSAFTRVTACTLARSPSRDPLSRGFSHFVTSMTAPVASGWSGCRVGLAPTGKRRLSTAHTRLGRCTSHHSRQCSFLRGVRSNSGRDLVIVFGTTNDGGHHGCMFAVDRGGPRAARDADSERKRPARRLVKAVKGRCPGFRRRVERQPDLQGTGYQPIPGLPGAQLAEEGFEAVLSRKQRKTLAVARSFTMASVWLSGLVVLRAEDRK